MSPIGFFNYKMEHILNLKLSYLVKSDKILSKCNCKNNELEIRQKKKLFGKVSLTILSRF